MPNISQPVNELRLKTHFNKIQQRLSPAAINTCRQIALSLKPKINTLLSKPNWERQVILEITTQAHYKDLSAMAGGDIEASVFIILMETVKSAQEDLRDTMQGLNETNKNKQSLREKLQNLQEELIDETEGKYRRHPPLIGK